MSNGQDVQLKHCPFCGIDYTTEEFLVRLWNEKHNGNPAIPWLRSPAWINQAMEIITKARNDVERQAQETAQRLAGVR